MMKFIKWFIAVAVIMLVWLMINIASTKQGWFVNAIAPASDRHTFMAKIKTRLENEANGNGVMLLIEGGNIADEYLFSKGVPVTKDTVFGVSSLGKWVAAVGVMTLVEQGKISLDEPVSSYLTQWELPASDYDNDGVTVRRLLSHTAGITDGLGHNGFDTREKIQPLTEHLTKALDSDEGVDGRVIVGLQPGSEFKYSGGSYNLLQLIVEEVSGMSFEAYMSIAVFRPLGMTKTTYKHDEVAQLAEYFNEDGTTRDYPFYTSLAATGLYTTANDLHKFLKLNVLANNIVSNGTGPNQILSQKTLADMRMPHASTMGIDIWGLGAMLFTSNNNGDFIIGHGGQSPSLNATLRVNPANGNGIILLETGNRALAADTATRWTLWETGNPDMYMLKNMIPDMLVRVAIGCVVILIVSLVLAWRSRTTK